MKQIIFVLAVSAMGLLSCKDKDKKQDNGKDTMEQKTTAVVQDPAKDSAAIRMVIIDFYNWYNKNYAKLEKYHLYSGIKKKDTPPYKMNWDEVEKYQQFVRDSMTQLGEEFITTQKHFFQQCDSAFKVDLQDDIPYGFDYDWYTNSQEDPQYLMDEINDKSGNWEIRVNGDAATVNISVMHDVDSKPTRETVMTMLMKKEKDKWTIAKIGDN